MREQPDLTFRARGSLAGVACGDAIGKQTEGLTRDGVRRWYAHGLLGFEGVPGSVIPRYVNNAKRQWTVGETTDDTERTIAVARAILEDGAVRHETVGRHLLACAKCVHPGLGSLWEFHQRGDPARVTSDHDGCGAAIRVAPVGILYRSHRLDELIAGAREASIPTHGGPLALAAAAATAVAVSAAIDGAGPDDIIALAARAAARAECERSGSDEASFARALERTYSDLGARRGVDPEALAAFFPNTPLTIVPLALSLAAATTSVETAVLAATNLGGDSDSVASIAAAVRGARFPATVNPGWLEIVESVNAHGLHALSDALSGLRR